MTVVDLSNWQDPQSINYALMRAAVSGAYVKVTQSTDYEDVHWKQHYTNLTGVPRGCYHFAGSQNMLGDPGAEAQHFANVFRQVRWEMRPTLDIEIGRPTTMWVKTFLSAFRAATGVELLRVYMPLNFAETFLVPGNWLDPSTDLWIARYAAALGWDHPAVVMWQYTNSGSLAGFGGDVDLSHEMHGWTPATDSGGVTPVSSTGSFPAIPDYTKNPPEMLDYAVALGWGTAHAGMAWENTQLILGQLAELKAQVAALHLALGAGAKQ